MNYLYKFIDREIYLNADEHQKVLTDMKAGKSLIVLRSGNLILNMSLVATVAETRKQLPLTDDQELLLLAAGLRKAEEVPKTKPVRREPHTHGLPDLKNPDDKVCAGCNHIHHIPGESKLCVGCSRQYKNSAIAK